MTSQQRDTRKGPAYPFWVRYKERLIETGMTQAEVLARTGLGAMTVDRLRTSPARAEGPRRKAVLAIADVLGIPTEEALILAGLAPGRDRVDVRAAINAAPEYTQDQKDALLGLLNVLDAANAASRESTDRVDRRA